MIYRLTSRMLCSTSIIHFFSAGWSYIAASLSALKSNSACKQVHPARLLPAAGQSTYDKHLEGRLQLLLIRHAIGIQNAALARLVAGAITALALLLLNDEGIHLVGRNLVEAGKRAMHQTIQHRVAVHSPPPRRQPITDGAGQM
jgi:hypothetical protein